MLHACIKKEGPRRNRTWNLNNNFISSKMFTTNHLMQLSWIWAAIFFVVCRTEPNVLRYKNNQGSRRRWSWIFLFLYSPCLTRTGACGVGSCTVWDGVGDEGGVGRREGMILRLWSQFRLVSSTSPLLLFVSSTLLLLLSSLLPHSNGGCPHFNGVIIVTNMLTLSVT